MFESCSNDCAISRIDNDRLHDSYHRCFGTSPPNIAAACPPVRPLPILRGLATFPIELLPKCYVSDRLQNVVSALASLVAASVRARAAAKKHGPESRT
jgi:hypothetical protein